MKGIDSIELNRKMIKWNEKVQYIITDVDDTIAPIYHNVLMKTVWKLEELLKRNIKIILISGQSVSNIVKRVTNHINPHLRKNIFISHCNGAEIYEFDKQGMLISEPFFSILQYVSIDKSKLWMLMEDIRKKFKLHYVFTTNIDEFKRIAGNSKMFVMVDDRNVQISIDFINGINKDDSLESDIRIDIIQYAKELFEIHNLVIEPKLGGMYAIDFNIKGVDKGLAVRRLFTVSDDTKERLEKQIILNSSQEVEVWGDSFSSANGNSDFPMCSSLPNDVRTICFRWCLDYHENYNIQQWNGSMELSEGLYEYLDSFLT